jgi:transposase
MYDVGLDVHQRTSTDCVLNSYGQVMQSRTVRGHWSKLIDELASWQHPMQVVYEASLGYGPIYQRLTAFCQRVVVAHPKKLKWIFRSRQKNDKVDAQKLAKLLYLDEVPEVHVPSMDVRNWRQWIEHRRRLVDKRTKVKNSLKALLRAEGIVKPRHVGGQWSKGGLQWLSNLVTASAADEREDQPLELVLPKEVVVRLPRGFDPDTLRHVVEALP